jgi:WD40 repeat protein
MKHESEVFGAVFTRDETRILSWSYGGTVRLWDAATGQQIGPTMKHDDYVNGASFNRAQPSGSGMWRRVSRSHLR